MDVRKFIKEFEISSCENHKSLPPVIAQGIEGNVYYYTEYSTQKYLIVSPSKEALRDLNTSELEALLPKFGKFEIEDFFKNRFLNAILITGDMTDIFNTTVLCSDFRWSCKFEKDHVKEIFLEKCFTIVKEDTDGNTTYLKLTGRRAIE